MPDTDAREDESPESVRDRLARLLPDFVVGQTISGRIVIYEDPVESRTPGVVSADLADRLERGAEAEAKVERVSLVREQLRKRFRDCPENQVLLIAAICNDLADALRIEAGDQ